MMLLLHMQIRRYFNKICAKIQYTNETLHNKIQYTNKTLYNKMQYTNKTLQNIYYIVAFDIILNLKRKEKKSYSK
jgi:CRISPR/Cas system-associated protein Cas5 (RAMP superfamily)